MLESVLPSLQGLLTAAKAMASFDAFRKGRKGDSRAIVEELKENSRLCFRSINDDVDLALTIPEFTTTDFDRLNKAGFDFNSLKSGRIAAYAGIHETDLASWAEKTTGELVENIYDKIKNLKSLQKFKPGHPTARRRLMNIHKRILLLLRHAEA